MGSCCSVTLFQCQCDVALINRCMDCTFGPARSLCMMEKNLTALKAASIKLQELKKDVDDEVEIAETESKRSNQVAGWMKAVEEKVGQVDILLENGDQELVKLCVGGCWSHSCKSSYIFGRDVSRKLKEVNGLISRGNFPKVAGARPAPAVELPSEPTLGTQSMIDKIWTQLQEREVGILGLYGMGGVGKTTLLEQIHNKYIEGLNDFDLIIYVQVSRHHKLEKVQNDIGRKLGLVKEDWKNREPDQKEADIRRLLRRKKFVLLLDDVWEPVNLRAVGVPHPDDLNWSKLLLTTRDQEVCNLMRADRKHPVKCLGKDEAWNLFKTNVNIAEDILSLEPEIPELAKRVAEKCAGLPLALKTIGLAMSCRKDKREWENAIKVLQKSAAQFEGMKKVLALLKFSYDNLKGSEIKNCFLYCALFPEDTSIHKDELIYKWMCEGFLNNYDDVYGALIKGSEMIGTLVRACLLEDINGQLKMHDVIREMALWLACEFEETKDMYNFLVQSGSTVPDLQKCVGVKRMSLMANDIESLERRPSFPDLLTLFLNNKRLKMISQDFFNSMSMLRVLDLSKNKDLNQLPSGISALESLQYLDLSGTGITELSIELKALVELIYLNLEHTKELGRIPQNVISGFPKLRVLRLDNSGVCKSIFVGSNEHLGKELQCLHLDMLTLTIHDVSSFKNFIASPKIVSCTQVLCLEKLSSLEISSLACMKSPYSDPKKKEESVFPYH